MKSDQTIVREIAERLAPEQKRRGIIQVTFDELHAALNLGSDVKVMDVWGSNFDLSTDNFRIKLSGDNLPEVAEGDYIPTIPIKDAQ